MDTSAPGDSKDKAVANRQPNRRTPKQRRRRRRRRRSPPPPPPAIDGASRREAYEIAKLEDQVQAKEKADKKRKRLTRLIIIGIFVGAIVIVIGLLILANLSATSENSVDSIGSGSIDSGSLSSGTSESLDSLVTVKKTGDRIVEPSQSVDAYELST